MEKTIVYFEKPGPEVMEETLRLAKRRAGEMGIKTVVIASTTGKTGARASEIFKGMNVVVVSHSAGMKGPNTQELTKENRKIITKNGGVILTTTHLFSGLNGAMRKKFSTYLLGDIVTNTLRIIGQGMKVTMEITVMAADAGLVGTGEDIISIGGTGRGADFAIVVTPVNSGDFFDMNVKEIICKPLYQRLRE